MTEIPELCGAYLNEARGSIVLPDVDPAEYPGVLFPDGIYHLYDHRFFYRSLQRNMTARVEAFTAQQSDAAA